MPSSEHRQRPRQQAKANPATGQRRPSPRHAAAKQKKFNPIPIVLGCVLVALVVAGGIGVVRLFKPTQETTQQQSQQASSTNQGSSASVKKDDKSAGQEAKDAEAKQKEEQTKEEKSEEQKTVPEAIKGQPASIDVMMIGDMLMHDEIVDSGAQGDGSYNFDFLFDHIKEYIDGADLRILNQETVMGNPSRGYHLTMGAAGPIMNTPTALADSEAKYGFNTILKATNHTLDLGYDGLGHELDYWKSAYPNMPVVGVNNPNASADDDSQNYVDNVYIFEKDGLKVGILNYTWATNENFDWDTDQKYISYMSEEKIRSDVEKARAAGAEMLIACPHWGIEYDTTPSEEEQTYSKLFCDLGVDLILGAHPHILQPVEVLKNAEGHKTVCFYSVGNFVAASIMQDYSLIGGIARATLQRSEDGTYSVSAASLIPTVICHTYGPNMTAFPISSWTNDLVAQSTRPSLTPDYAYSFCSDVLGDSFDTSTGVYTLNLEK